MERTLLIAKPDTINRCLLGKIISRFEEKGLKIVGMKMDQLKVYALREHYEQHKEKPFFEEMLEFMTSIPSVLIVIEGKDTVKVVRKLIGKTTGREAEPGTIRGDYAMSRQTNLVHASANKKTAKKEIKRFFKKDELFDYDKMHFNWIYCKEERGLYTPIEPDGRVIEVEEKPGKKKK